MITGDLERLPLTGWIIGRADGLFKFLPEFVAERLVRIVHRRAGAL